MGNIFFKLEICCARTLGATHSTSKIEISCAPDIRNGTRKDLASPKSGLGKGSINNINNYINYYILLLLLKLLFDRFDEEDKVKDLEKKKRKINMWNKGLGKIKPHPNPDDEGKRRRNILRDTFLILISENCNFTNVKS